MRSNIKPNVPVLTLVLLGIALLCAGTSLAVLPALETPREPHDYRAYGLDCRNCHKSVGLKTSGGTVKPITEICRMCHKLEGKLSHPVDIKPSFALPADMPVDEKGNMTCVTCHDPHRGYMNPLTEKRTMFLRREGSKKDFCMACHYKA